MARTTKVTPALIIAICVGPAAMLGFANGHVLGGQYAARWPKSTSISTVTSAPPTTAAATASTVLRQTTTTAHISIHCDLKYCVNGTEMCLYWAGVTAWDPIQGGPVPGEVATSIGACLLLSNSASITSTSTATPVGYETEVVPIRSYFHA